MVMGSYILLRHAAKTTPGVNTGTSDSKAEGCGSDGVSGLTR